MPILPAYEPRTGTMYAKTRYELSLEYQLEKLIYFCTQFSDLLCRERKTHYIENDCRFYFDAVINNAATLAEYYLPYVIYSVIATTRETPFPPRFDAFRKNISKKGYLCARKDLFEHYHLGVLIKSDEKYKPVYLKQCEEAFDESVLFLLDGRYDIIFTLNNFIKHNAMNFDYAPRYLTHDGKLQNFHYLRFEDDQHFMLGDSALKNLIKYPFDDITAAEKTLSIPGSYEFESKGQFKNILLFEHNSILYTKSSLSAGISSASFMTLICQLMEQILSTMKRNVEGSEITQFKKYSRLLLTVEDLKKYVLAHVLAL